MNMQDSGQKKQKKNCIDQIVTSQIKIEQSTEVNLQIYIDL